MSGDLRGFCYALEPLHKQREWKFDAALALLGNLQRQIAECDAARKQMEQECRTQAARVGRAWATRPNPVAQVRLLAYLAVLHGHRTEAEREIAALREQLTQAQRECAIQQQKLEVLDQHRADMVKTYVGEQFRKSSAQADQDWSARRHDGVSSEGLS